jgi:hypothetical protein
VYKATPNAALAGKPVANVKVLIKVWVKETLGDGSPSLKSNGYWADCSTDENGDYSIDLTVGTTTADTTKTKFQKVQVKVEEEETDIGDSILGEDKRTVNVPIIEVKQPKRTCFAAGTPVLTPSGSRRIEEFREGDLVLARTEVGQTEKVDLKRVEKVFVHEGGRILHVHVGTHVIRTTAEHRFYAHGKGWVAAGQLSIGDRLNSHDGQEVVVGDLFDTDDRETVYNLCVADHHTYFVGDATWGFSVWVHNKKSEEEEDSDE